jgi:hypothetical protein
MNSCPKCGAHFADSVRLCPNDGTVLESGATVDTRVGTLLDGKYKLEAPLGEGGMGTVYRARHLMLDKPVALKLIKGDPGRSPDVIRRFQREARAASNLNHPNIAAAYDLGQTSDGTLYIAMELVRGQSLKDAIRGSGPLEAQRIGRILGQVASALAVAHRNGIIHRDLKPQNIMLAKEPDGTEVAKLLDFGIAKTFDEHTTQLTATGFVLGTPQYMSPEQAAGRPIDARSDLYSLGVIMFEMLVGEVPFNDPSTPALLVKHLTEPAPLPSLRRPDLHIAPALEAVALRCMEKDPAARYQTAEEFTAGLGGALGTLGTIGPAPGAAEAGVATVIVPTPSLLPITVGATPGGATPGVATTVLPPARVPPPAEKTGPMVPRVGTTIAPSAAPPAVVVPTTVMTPTPAPPPAQKTGTVSSPASASAAALAAAAGGTMPPPPPSLAAQKEPAAGPPPVSLAQPQASAPTRTNPTGRNALVVGAVFLLLIAAGAYAAGTWYRGRNRTTAVASVAPATPPSTPTATPTATATPPATPPPDAPAAAPPAAPPATPGNTTPSLTPLSTADPVTAPPTPAGSVPAPPRGAAGAGAGTVFTGGSDNRQGPGQTPATTPAIAAAPGAAPGAPQPANPVVVFRCTGSATNVCGALRSALGRALEAQSILAAQDPARADILVDAQAEIVSEREEKLFGTVFVTRTYSVELSGESRRTSQVVPMPAATSFSFDDRIGQEKLAGQAQLIATAAAEKIRAFWDR